MIFIVWRFTAKPERIAEFECHYKSEGTWAQLFRRSSSFLGTTLLRDTSVPNRYLLWDCWDSLASFERFKHDHAADYNTLDKHCEVLTEEEIRLGLFESLD